MHYATYNPPTKLIQNYFSCVMNVWDSFYAATGLASSNSQLYIALGIAVYLFVLVTYQNYVNNAQIPWKSQKVFLYLLYISDIFLMRIKRIYLFDFLR